MDRNVIWIDHNENELGEVSISKAHTEGLLHRIAVVYLINDSGEILVQKRMDGRLDHSAAGHVDAGESYLRAAKRELEEELGIDKIRLTEIGDSSSSEDGNKIRHKFKIYWGNGQPGKLDPHEVESVYWADPKEVWNDMLKDDGDKKYCGGFKSTLKLFLTTPFFEVPKR